MPVRGRLLVDVEDVMGFFNNMLPVYLSVDTQLTLIDWVRKVKQELLEAFANQDVPFERLASEPEFTGYSQKAGLYQGLFSFQDARERQLDWGGLSHKRVAIMQGGATEDLGMWLVESESGLSGGINFNADLFRRETAQLFHRRFLTLLRDAAARPQATLAELLTAPSDEQNQWRTWHESRRTQAAAPVARGSGSTDKSAAETLLAEIWSGLLGIAPAQISGSDNFFDVGGNSLLAMQAVADTERRLGVKVDPRRYVYESLGQLAAASSGVNPAATAAAGAGDAEAGLSRIWAELLGLDAAQIQAGDNFFDLGGSSLLAMRAVSEGERLLGLKIDPRRYVYESLRQLAATAPLPAAMTATIATSRTAPAKEAPTKSRLFGLFGRGKS
jgi:acyl carrier protein